ncbi:MAG TPA: tyrosine-type recombinase/integrase [Acidimicrobiales bacterium]|nr:tyrosine-type recombinase/integrase [Acidimicrobiales bacterium]
MASIQKRSTPRGPMWRVRWWVPAPDGGRVMRYSKPFPTEGEARRHREKVEADERKGLTTDYSGAEQLFGDYVQTWLDSRLVKGRPLAPRTRYEYEGLLRRNILPTFGSTRLRAISATDVREWLAALVERAGNDQAAKSYRVLRAVLNTAVADELLVRNPCKIRGAGQWDAPERPFVPTEVVLQLADAIVDVDKTPDKTGCSRLRSLLLLAGFAGLRPGELLALRRNDIDLLHHLVAVDENAPEVGGKRILGPPKSEAGKRQVAIPAPIMPDIEDHLDRFVAAEPDAWVFIGPRGAPIGENYLSVYFRKAVARVPGAPTGLRVYDLRHHAATLTAQVPGVTTKELMARIGHSSPRAALIYQHATAERDRRIADAMGEAIVKASKQSTVVRFGVPGVSREATGVRSDAAKSKRPGR